MLEKVMGMLGQSPVDMRDVLSMADAAKQGGYLFAGSANALLLSLLEGLGLGRALARVQQPCTVVCTPGSELRIELHSAAGDVHCTSLEDLAVRLAWPENAGAQAGIQVPGGLGNKERLVFAILDEQNWRAQLQAHALGVTGAAIVIAATDAPAAHTYQCAKWLAESCALQDAATVLVCGATDAPDCAPAQVLAVMMGKAELPVVCCNTQMDRLADKLAECLARDAGCRSNGALAREMIRRALEKLAAEEQRLSGSTVADAPVLTLAQRFEAQIPPARLKAEHVLTAAACNGLDQDVRAFAIFLQGQIEGLLQEGASALPQPKEALRTFSQGYLSDIMASYCGALIRDMCRVQAAPRLEQICRELLAAPWLRECAAEGRLSQAVLEGFNEALLDMAGKVGDTLNMAVDQAVRGVADGLLGQWFHSLTDGAQFMILPAKKYAAQKAQQLRDALDVTTQQYQDMLQKRLMPQVAAEILYWFDSHMARLLAHLRQEDERIAQQYADGVQRHQADQERLAAIQAMQDALRALL